MLLSTNNLIYRVFRSSILFALSLFATVAVAMYETDSSVECSVVGVPAGTDISMDSLLSLSNDNNNKGTCE